MELCILVIMHFTHKQTNDILLLFLYDRKIWFIIIIVILKVFLWGYLYISLCHQYSILCHCIQFPQKTYNINTIVSNFDDEKTEASKTLCNVSKKLYSEEVAKQGNCTSLTWSAPLGYNSMITFHRPESVYL